MKKTLWLFTLVVITFSSCKQTRPKQERNADSLRTEFKVLNDSIQVAWQVMMGSDSAKLGNVKRLLQEVSYTKVHDQALLDSLLRLQAALPAQRYTMETMTSEKIDAYDLATDSLLRRLPQLMASVPDLDRYPLCAQLMQEIEAANQALLLHRVHYDNYAKEYNRLISEYGSELEKLGYASLQPKRLFQLGA